MSVDARCRIEMLGGLRALLGSGADPLVVDRFRSHKTAALLAYLALASGRDCARESLIEALWPDLTPEAARDNLSTTLSALRRQMEPAGTPAGSILCAERHAIALNPQSVTADVAEFEQHLARAARLSRTSSIATAERADLLAAAVALYRGELLPGFYEEWALAEQARLDERYVEALDELVAVQESLGRTEEALATARLAVRADPLRETPRRALMRLLVARGDASAALDAYAEFEALLCDEAGMAPEPETRRLADAIRRHPNAFRAATPAAMAAGEAPATGVEPASPPAAPSPPSPATVSSLPLVLTRFFGRERERDLLQQTLTDEDDGAPRVVTLLGPGGVGKTRLAVDVARRLSGHFADRTWFASLAELPVAALVPNAVAAALGIPSGGNGGNRGAAEPLDRAATMLSSLGGAPCLLVLDNAEHLLRGGPAVLGPDGKGDLPAGSGLVTLIRRLLAAAPGLRCLVTSRQPLRLTGEQQFPIAPLGIPGTVRETPAVDLLRNEAVALYADRARLARPDFAITDTNAIAVADLCCHLEGIPLALEMVASRARLMPPAEMLRLLREKERGRLDLAAPRRDAPARHQSLRAAMSWSYGLLAPEYQTVFRRLAVFRGGWTWELAAHVCAADDPAAFVEILTDLEEHSLIVAVPDAERRFRMLEPVREFAEECLEAAGELDSVRHALADALRALSHGFCWAPDHAEAERMAQMQWEMPNVRATLEWLLRPGAPQEDDAHLALTIAGYVGAFWQIRGPRREGVAYLNRTLDHPHNQSPTSERASALFKRALLLNMIDPAGARRSQEEAIEISRALGLREFVGKLIGDLGTSLQQMGDARGAEAAYRESIAIAREFGNRRSEATGYLNLGAVADDRGDLATAREQYDRALQLYRETGNSRDVAICLDNLGSLARTEDRPDEAARLWREAITEYARVGEVMNRLCLFEWLSWIDISQGRHQRAVRLMAASAALQVSLDSPIPAVWLTEHAEFETAVRQFLGPDAFAAAWTEGARLTLDAATVLALEEPDASPCTGANAERTPL